MTMRLHNLKHRPGAKHRTKRLGIGESSGHGKTSGRGGKGQTARSGGTIRLGFEGGQMPLLRRIPKRGFNNKVFRTHLATVNVADLNVFADGATVTPEALVEQGLLKKLLDGVKVLGDGELKKKLTVKAQRFSGVAKDKITKAGGQCEELPLAGIHHKPPAPTPAGK
jgi:large subunit ribosomal protein L15